MFKTRCESCDSLLHLRNVKLNPRWRLLSTQDDACYCPHCNHKLNNVMPNAVELAKTLSPKNIAVFFAIMILWLLAIATETVAIFGPVFIILFGIYLAKTSPYKDHRIIGWFLIIVFGVVFILSNS